MSVFDMLDPIQNEIDVMRAKGEYEESKRDCKGCRDRIGIPCLVASHCTKLKGGSDETGETL